MATLVQEEVARLMSLWAKPWPCTHAIAWILSTLYLRIQSSMSRPVEARPGYSAPQLLAAMRSSQKSPMGIYSMSTCTEFCVWNAASSWGVRSWGAWMVVEVVVVSSDWRWRSLVSLTGVWMAALRLAKPLTSDLKHVDATIETVLDHFDQTASTLLQHLDGLEILDSQASLAQVL